MQGVFFGKNGRFRKTPKLFSGLLSGSPAILIYLFFGRNPPANLFALGPACNTMALSRTAHSASPPIPPRDNKPICAGLANLASGHLYCELQNR
jgi:hypothetical protein